MGLLDVDPLQVASSALRLASVEDAVVDVRREVVRTGPSLARWRGEAAAEFRGRSAALLAGLPSVAQAYGEASSVVLRYARELEDCQAEARRAVALAAEADRLSASAPLVGPDPGAGLRALAERLRASAEEAHRAAEHRAVSALRDLAGSAPRPRHAAGFERFWSDFTGSAREQLVAPFLLAGMALEAAGGNRAARDDLAAGVAQSWRVWEPVAAAWEQLGSGHGGVALAQATAFIMLRKPDLSGKSLVRDRDLAVDDAWQEAGTRRLVELLGTTQQPWRPGSGRIGLYDHESMGGHGIRQHISKSLAILRWRADHGKVRSASTFPDATTAQRALDEAVALRPDVVQAVLGDAIGAPARSLRVDLHRPLGYGYRKGNPDLLTTTEVVVVLARVKGGILVVTCYPRVR